jgi:hypothetical protein
MTILIRMSSPGGEKTVGLLNNDRGESSHCQIADNSHDCS